MRIKNYVGLGIATIMLHGATLYAPNEIRDIRVERRYEKELFRSALAGLVGGTAHAILDIQRLDSGKEIGNFLPYVTPAVGIVRALDTDFTNGAVLALSYATGYSFMICCAFLIRLSHVSSLKDTFSKKDRWS